MNKVPKRRTPERVHSQLRLKVGDAKALSSYALRLGKSRHQLIEDWICAFLRADAALLKHWPDSETRRHPRAVDYAREVLFDEAVSAGFGGEDFREALAEFRRHEREELERFRASEGRQ